MDRAWLDSIEIARNKVYAAWAYHRWHHTSDEEGIDKNFAGIFPIWDILFGTCHFPHREPHKFGVHRDLVPETLWGQLLYPFRRGQSAAADQSVVGPSEGTSDSTGERS